MGFVTVSYLVFLMCCFGAYYVLPKIARPCVLLAASYVFYLYDPKNASFVWLLILLTAVTYGVGLLLQALQKKPALVRKIVLAISLVVCFGFLVYYKYCGFVLNIFGQGDSWSIAQPLGISFFLFQATGYLVDIYRGKYPAEKNPLHYALFVSFFPCIVAGPIERGSHMLGQFWEKKTFDYAKVSGGAFRVLWGIFKKLIIANVLYAALKQIVGHMDQYPGQILLLAALGFSYYLYCDFSALSDIAIGSAAIFGYEVMENFRRPLGATDFTDLWRRWHISLSSWFRDYLYFPLGGSRKGKLRACVNQVIVFSVSGLWHGASWGYLLWGALNGIFIVVGKETRALRSRLYRYNPLYYFRVTRKFFQCIVTYLLFSFCFVFFCTELFSVAGQGIPSGFYMLTHMFSGWDFATGAKVLETLGFTGLAGWVFFGAIALVECLEWPLIPMHTLIRRIPFVLRWPLYYALLLAIYFYGEFGVSAFVYQAY